MISRQIKQERLHVALLGFVFLFFFIPFLESRTLSFSVTSLIFTFVLMMNVRVLPVSAKYGWFFVVLSILAYCFDLLLMITFHPLLSFVLAVLAYGIYAFCFGIYVWVIVKNFGSPDHDPESLVKSGLCGYLLLGFFWMTVYTFINILSPATFSAVPVQNISFFYFSFLTLGLLMGQGGIGAYPLQEQYVVGLEAITGQIYLLFFIARLAILSYSYEARR